MNGNHDKSLFCKQSELMTENRVFNNYIVTVEYLQ